MIIMYLDNHDYTSHDDLIIVTKNNHDNFISIFNDNCPILYTSRQLLVGRAGEDEERMRRGEG